MISAIVSAYYAEEFIGGRITNLLKQVPKCEIVVVCENGSVEDQIASSFEDVIVVRTVSIPSVYEAWNIGIRVSTGVFITNANSDDRLYPGALALLEHHLLTNEGVALVYADSDIVAEVEGPPINRFVWAEGGFDELLKGCFIGPMPMWRRSLHEKYGFFDESMRSSGDYEFWLRIASHGECFKHVKQVVGSFYSSTGTASRREPLRRTWEDARARSRYKKGD